MKFTPEEIEAMRYALDELEWHCDEGPEGAGWRSARLTRGFMCPVRLLDEADVSDHIKCIKSSLTASFPKLT